MFKNILGFSYTVLFLLLLDSKTAVCYDRYGWELASDFISDAIDETASPCDDFYKFACGKWKQNYGRFIDEPHKALTAMAENLKRAIDGIRDRDQNVPKYQKSLKYFYDQCKGSPDDYMEVLTNIYKSATKQLGPMPIIAKALGQAIRPKTPYQLIGQMQHLFNTKIFIDASVIEIKDQCASKPAILLTTPDLVTNMQNFTAQNLYDLGRQFNVTLDMEAIRERLDKLEGLTDIFSSVEKMPFSTVDEGSFKVSELLTMYDVDWRHYFSGLLPKATRNIWMQHDHTVKLKPLSYFRSLNSNLSGYTYEDMLDYAYVRFFRTYMKFYNVTPELLRTKDEHTSIDDICIEYVLKYASAAAARLFFESQGTSALEWKHDIELLAENVFAAARFLIHTTDWLSIEEKAAVIAKMKSVSFAAGIPEWIFDDETVTNHTPPASKGASFYDNDLTLFRAKFNWQMRPLETGVFLPLSVRMDENYNYVLDPDPNFAFNAYYRNRGVNLWLGAIAPPMYNYSYPLSLKMGLLGWIIGHELMHGFDEGNVRERHGLTHWLSEETLTEFKKRANCIKKQYSGVCYHDLAYCISGGNTISDNIADIDGLKVAYMAYKFTAQTLQQPEPPLPRLRNYTDDQLFFISAARVWCGSGKDVYMYDQRDDHSPGVARIELSMMNFPAFAQAFNCPAGSRFAPLQTCTMWGDFLEPNIAD